MTNFENELIINNSEYEIKDKTYEALECILD